jgi:hypothetical protein
MPAGVAFPPHPLLDDLGFDVFIVSQAADFPFSHSDRIFILKVIF